MKERLKIFPMKVLAAFSLLTCFSSLIFLLGRGFLPDHAALWYLFPGVSWLWGVASYLFPGKGRAVFSGIGIALALLAGWLFIVPISFSGVLLLAPCIALLVMIPLGWGRPIWGEWHIGVWIMGVLMHLIAFALGRRPDFSGISGPLSICFALNAFLLVLTMNRQSLRDGMHGKEKAPPALRSRNRVLVIALFIPALLASTWGLLGKWLDQLWDWLLLGVGYLIHLFLSLFDRGQETTPGGEGASEADMLMGLGEASEPSALAKLLEKIFVVIAAVAIVVLLVVAGIILYRKIKTLIRYLMEKLRKYAQAAGEDYVDEAESTLNLDEKAQAFKDKLQKMFAKGPKEPAWSELSGRERARRLYRQFIHLHPKWRGMTAREAIDSDDTRKESTRKRFAELYERARYSDHPVTETEADAMREQLK